MPSPFATLVRSELAQARSKHANQHSAHESYAVILEEVEEFWNEVRLQTDQRSKMRMLRELTQIGAMAQRAAEDLGLIDHDRELL